MAQNRVPLQSTSRSSSRRGSVLMSRSSSRRGSLVLPSRSASGLPLRPQVGRSQTRRASEVGLNTVDLEISNIHVAELPVGSFWDMTDPYVMFEVDGNSVRVEAQENTVCHSYNEVLSLPVDLPATMEVTVWDENQIFADALLGTWTFDLTAAAPEAEVSHTIVDNCEKEAGFVRFRYKHVPSRRKRKKTEEQRFDVANVHVEPNVSIKLAHHLTDLSSSLVGCIFDTIHNTIQQVLVNKLDDATTSDEAMDFGHLSNLMTLSQHEVKSEENAGFFDATLHACANRCIVQAKEVLINLIPNLTEDSHVAIVEQFQLWDIILVIIGVRALRQFRPMGFYYSKHCRLRVPRFISPHSNAGKRAYVMGPPLGRRPKRDRKDQQSVDDIEIISELHRPSGKRFDLKPLRSNSAIFLNPEIDETFGMDQVSPQVFQLLAGFPIVDTIEFMPVDLIPDFRTALQLHDRDMTEHWENRGICPPAVVPIDNPKLDEVMTRICFYGYAQHRVEKVLAAERTSIGLDTAAFKVDLSSMQELGTRDDFETYGGIAYFDQQLKIIAIKDPENVLQLPIADSTPGDVWDHTKFRFRCSLLLIITGVDHLANVHFAVASAMLNALNESVLMDANHILRAALHPFTYNTSFVNQSAGVSLIPEKSIVMHMSGLKPEAYSQIFGDLYTKGKEWQPTPAFWEDKDLDLSDAQMPLKQDGVDMFKIFREFFSQCLENVSVDDPVIQQFWQNLRKYSGSTNDKTTNENQTTPAYVIPESLGKDLSVLVDHLAQFAYNVTVQHELVGTLSEYMADRANSGFRTVKRERSNSCIDNQSYVVSMVLLGFTELNTPALRNDWNTAWHSCFKQLEEEGMDDFDVLKRSWGNFQSALTTQANIVSKRNDQQLNDDDVERRKYQFVAAHPDYLRCGLSF
eukprot:m.16135 g.16135  ORF g.16135 m.16135 type:complete len:913 (+) comp10885_c0_seq1:253-2991(+)